MNKKTTTQRIRELEKNVATLVDYTSLLNYKKIDWKTVIILSIIFFTIILAMDLRQDYLREQQITDLNTNLNNLITWECVENKTMPYQLTTFRVDSTDDEGLGWTYRNKTMPYEFKGELKITEYFNSTYCTLERPIINPNAQRAVWYEL